MDAGGQRLLVKAGELSSAAERCEISEQIQPFLRRLIGAATEKPWIRRHHGSADDEPGIVEMGELPVAGTNVEFARQIWPDAARAPKLRVIIFGFPGLGGRAEAAHIGGERADLLRVTVGASFASINDSASLFGRGERCHRDGSHPLDFISHSFSTNEPKETKTNSQE